MPRPVGALVLLAALLIGVADRTHTFVSITPLIEVRTDRRPRIAAVR